VPQSEVWVQFFEQAAPVLSQLRSPGHGLGIPDSQVPFPSQDPGVNVLPLQESQPEPA
jgi:hypothetical protein